jgi:DNA-binding XRE family transcriptional regulator
MTQEELAARVGVSRQTMVSLEQGDLSTSLAVLAQTLAVLGLEEDLDRIAADDELGRRMQDVSLRRPRRRGKATR